MSFCNNDSFGQGINEDSNVLIANDLKDQIPPLSNSDNNQGTNLSFENIGNLNSNNTEEAQQNEIL